MPQPTKLPVPHCRPTAHWTTQQEQQMIPRNNTSHPLPFVKNIQCEHSVWDHPVRSICGPSPRLSTSLHHGGHPAWLFPCLAAVLCQLRYTATELWNRGRVPRQDPWTQQFSWGLGWFPNVFSRCDLSIHNTFNICEVQVRTKQTRSDIKTTRIGHGYLQDLKWPDDSEEKICAFNRESVHFSV